MRSYKLIGGTLLAALLVTTSLQGTALAQTPPASISIVSQDLGAALLALSRQTGRDVLFTSDIVAGKRSSAVTGAASFEQALQKLLDGTGLQFAIGKDGSATLGQRGTAVQVPVRPAVAAKPSSLVAEELVVVGSRLARSQDGPSPVTVITRERIDTLGVTDIADVLKYLPQQSFQSNNFTLAANSRSVQLRGLSPGTTLVLLNGRRTVVGSATASRNVFDLNTIPIAMVERVEVLANSASAVYGADAVGGVVNIVLKSGIERPVIDLYYGTPEDGGIERRISSAIGGDSGRARGSLVVDYFKRDLLVGGAREIIANADYRRFGATDRSVTFTNPGNVCAVSGNLPGLSTPCAAVPAGSTGVGLTPASFAATAGQQNRTARSRDSSIVGPATRYSAMANGSWDVTDSITAFAELMYIDRNEYQTGASPSISRGQVPASNPFNPFGAPVLVDYLLTGIGPSLVTSHEKWSRGVTGLKGKLGGWDWELSALATHSDRTYFTSNQTDPTRVAAALSATNPALALNVFQDGPGGSYTLLHSLINDPSTNVSTYSSDSQQLGGFVRGELFQLPAGPAQLVAGGEWRHEDLSVIQASANLFVTTDKARRSSSSAYAEFRAPLVGERELVPFVRDIALTLAGRYDQYSDFGGTFNAQYGVEWRPVPALLVRGSYGTSYRAPGLWELFQTTTVSPNFAFADPRRGGQSFPGTLIGGGNPNLDPETSHSASFGAVWSPQIEGKPRLSAGYWRIQLARRIFSGLAPATVLANERYLPERIVRAAPTAADIAAGRPGQILSVDTTLINVGGLQTSGLDLEASAEFDTPYGRILPVVSATRVQKYKAADFVTTPVYERVGVADTNGTIPRWKVVGSLGWSWNGITVTGTARFVSSYADTTLNVRNGRTVPSQTLYDLQGSFNMEEIVGASSPVARGLVVRVGAVNLFNRKPSFSDVAAAGYDPSQADTRQRFLYASLSKSF